MIDLSEIEDDIESVGMEAVLRFPLPENREEFDDAISGTLYKDVLLEIDRSMRDHLKYGDQFEHADDACNWVRAEIRELNLF